MEAYLIFISHLECKPRVALCVKGVCTNRSTCTGKPHPWAALYLLGSQTFDSRNVILQSKPCGNWPPPWGGRSHLLPIPIGVLCCLYHMIPAKLDACNQHKGDKKLRVWNGKVHLIKTFKHIYHDIISIFTKELSQW